MDRTRPKGAALAVAAVLALGVSATAALGAAPKAQMDGAILVVAQVDGPMPLDTRCTAEGMTRMVGNAHVMAQGAGPSTIVVVEGVTATPPPLTLRP